MNFSLDSSNLNIAVVQTGGRKTDPIFVHYSSPVPRFDSEWSCLYCPWSALFLEFVAFRSIFRAFRVPACFCLFFCLIKRDKNIAWKKGIYALYIYIYNLWYLLSARERDPVIPDCLLHHPVSLAFRQCSTQSPVVATLNVPYDLPVLFPSRGENEASVSQSTAQHHLAVHELLTCYLC